MNVKFRGEQVVACKQLNLRDGYQENALKTGKLTRCQEEVP